MGRPRKYATNAERQRAYRERNLPVADLRVPEHFDLPRETDGRPWTLRSFVWGLVNQGFSVGFVAEAVAFAVCRFGVLWRLPQFFVPEKLPPNWEQTGVSRL